MAKNATKKRLMRLPYFLLHGRPSTTDDTLVRTISSNFFMSLSSRSLVDSTLVWRLLLDESISSHVTQRHLMEPNLESHSTPSEILSKDRKNDLLQKNQENSRFGVWEVWGPFLLRVLRKESPKSSVELFCLILD